MFTSRITALHFPRLSLVLIFVAAVASQSGCSSLSGSFFNQFHYHVHSSLPPPPAVNPLAEIPAAPSSQQQIQREPVQPRAGGEA